MNLYSISELEQFSGIKSHTIRIWEKRYKALKPRRSKGNTRYYDSFQLRRLLNIVSLSENGYKISRVARLKDEQIFDLLDKAIKETTALKPYEYFIAQLILASVHYDEASFDRHFAASRRRFGFEETYSMVVYPLLLRVGLMWQNDDMCVAQEHFLSNIIRKKLYAAIDSLPAADAESEPWVLFLPENEFHDIGLLFASYLIRLAGKKVYFLGSSVPLNSLKNAVSDTLPSNLLLFLVHNNSTTETQKYIDTLRRSFGDCTIYLAGNHKLINTLKLKKRMHWLQSADQLKASFLNNNN
jgi:MerR family transcriptional regulator, light-induced transcriptional regulator